MGSMVDDMNEVTTLIICRESVYDSEDWVHISGRLSPGQTDGIYQEALNRLDDTRYTLSEAGDIVRQVAREMGYPVIEEVGVNFPFPEAMEE
jgi:hypothetical protein